MKPTSLTFLPRTTQDPHADHQLLQAMFAAARAVIGIAGNLQTIGDPAIVIPADMGGRVMTTRWRHDHPQTILEHMLELNPGIRVLVHGQEGSAEQAIRAAAIDVLTSGDPSKDKGGDALDIVQQLARYATVWRDGAAALAREGLLEVGASDGPVEFYAGLRAAITYLLDTRAERARDAGQERTRRVELEAEVARLTRALEIERARHIVGTDPPSIEAAADFEAFLGSDKEARAAHRAMVESTITAAALTVLDVLEPLPEGGAHKLRVHQPGAGILRVILAADLPDDVIAEVGSEVDDKAAELVGSLSIEREPGELPEDSYAIEEGHDHNGEPGDGVHPGSAPTEEWTTYAWKNADVDDAGPHRRTRAEAIDDAWRDYAATVVDAAQSGDHDGTGE